MSTESIWSSYSILGGMNVNGDILTTIKFDLSSIPQGSYINGAYLKLFAYHANPDAPCELVVYRFTDDWDERRITYNNMPSAVKATPYKYTVRGTGYLRSTGDEAWQMTDLVKKWVTGEYRNYGIYLLNQSGQESSLCKFYSKDETVQANQGKKPQLIVEYLPPLKILSTTVPANQISDTVANIYWTTNNPVLSTVYYRKSAIIDWRSQSSNETVTSKRVILQNLSPNTRYIFRIKVHDAGNQDYLSQDFSFTTKPSSVVITPGTLRQLNPNLSGLAGLIGASNRPASAGGQAASGNTNTGSSSQPGQSQPDTTQQNQNNEIKIVNLTTQAYQTGGTFSWTTKEEDGSAIMADIKTGGFVFLSKNGQPTKESHDFDFGKNQGEVNHTVILKYLEPETTYNYLIYSEDDGGRTGTIRGTFTTNASDSIANGASEDQSSNNSQSETGDSLNNGNSADQMPIPSSYEDNNSQNAKASAQQSPEQSLIAGLTNNNLSSKPLIFIIILLVLIIILLILLLTKKNKTAGADKKTDAQKHIAMDDKHTGVTSGKKEKMKVIDDKKTEQTPKKGKNWLKIIIIVVIGYFVLSMIGSVIGMFLPLGLAPYMLIDELRNKLGQQTQTQKISDFEKEAETTGSFSKISLPGNPSLSYSAVEQTAWPKGTIGGLYKISPSGNFSKLASVTIDLKEPTQKGFALGYWHADTKKWEYIPTIRIFGNTYKALLAHASEVGGYSFGLAGALEYNPRFQDPGIQADWESLQTYLKGIAQRQASGFDTEVEVNIATGKLDNLAIRIINQCATHKTFSNQIDYFFIWNIAQLLKATKVDERMGDAMNQCIDPQATRADSKYEYMIRDTQDLKNDLNIPEIMQFAFKGNIKHEGYPLVSGYGNTDWKTDWQVVARTEYHADVQYGSLLNSLDPPTPEGTWGNNIVTHVLLFSLKNIRQGETFRVRGVSIGDAPGYFRNWHEDLKWTINHPSTTEQPIPSDPNKRVFETTGTLVEDKGKSGAVIKYGGYSKEQQAQMDQVASIIKNSGDNRFQGIPAYFQEAAGQITLNIVPGIPYNE